MTEALSGDSRMARLFADASLEYARPGGLSLARPVRATGAIQFAVSLGSWITSISMLAWVHSHPLPVRAHHMLFQTLLALLSAGLLFRAVSTPFFASRVVGAATAGELGAIRAIACFVLAAMAYCEQIGAA